MPLISEISENVHGIKMEAPQMFPPRSSNLWQRITFAGNVLRLWSMMHRELILEIVGSLLLVKRLNAVVFHGCKHLPWNIARNVWVTKYVCKRWPASSKSIRKLACSEHFLFRNANTFEHLWVALGFLSKMHCLVEEMYVSIGPFSDREPSPEPVFQPMVSDCLPVCWSLQQHAAEQERVSLKTCIGLTERRSDKDKKTCQEVNQLSWESS